MAGPAASVSPRCPTTPPAACIPSSPRTSRRGRRRRPTAGLLTPALPTSHDPHVVGKMAAHVVMPWAHRVFSNLKVWALGVYHRRLSRPAQRLSRPATQAFALLPRRVRLPLQPTPHSPRRLSLA